MLRFTYRKRRNQLRVGIALAITTLLGGCALMPSDPGNARADVELSSLRVGVTKVIDTVPLRLAVDKGQFARGGLRIELVEQANSRLALKALAAGQIEVAFGTNLTLLKSAAKGTPLQLQGEAYISGPNTMALITLPGSGYEEPTAKPAPVIAVDPDDDLGELATRSRLATEGIDPDKIRFVELSFDETVQALQERRVDAVWATQPRISQAQKDLGAKIVTDTARGRLQDFPMSSYVARREFASANPRTFALFRELLGDAQGVASDPSVVRAALKDVLDIDDTASTLVSVGTYPTSLNGVRLQRVADLMHTAGLLEERLDTTAMVPSEPVPDR